MKLSDERVDYRGATAFKNYFEPVEAEDPSSQWESTPYSSSPALRK